MNQDTTRRALKAELATAILGKLDALNECVNDMTRDILVLEARLDEARSIPEKIVNKFATVLAERDTTYEERRTHSEVVLSQLVEKIAHGSQNHPEENAMETDSSQQPQTYTEVVRGRAKAKKSKTRENNSNAAARAKSKSAIRTKKGAKKSEHLEKPNLRWHFFSSQRRKLRSMLQRLNSGRKY